jgi:serpin B
MGIAFDPDQADFTGMYKGPEPLFISKVKHKTFVEVNEEGTEAAAVTSVEIAMTSAPPWMRVDRPFVFVIRENKSQTILFMGKIVEPTLR